MRRLTEQRFYLTICALLLTAAGAYACNVPVYRYALDHWQADQYRAIIVHHGPLSSSAQQAVDQLKATIESKQCNLALHSIDAAGQLSDSDQNYLDTSKLELSEDQPQLLVHYPSALQIRPPVVRLDLTGSEVTRLLDSPVRRDVLQRLSQGQSAVWLLVKSGQAAHDQAAVQIIEKELRQLQATLELPKLTDDPADAVVGGPALRVEFSLLTVDRQSDEEEPLVQMLVNSEPDLKEIDQPILFAAFGRGRVLWPLVGPGITAENIKEMAVFVTGACSCQVKEQNPGFDLLLKSNWEELLPWTKTVVPPTASDPNTPPELVAIPKGSAQPVPALSPEPINSPRTNWARLCVVAALVLLVPLLTRWVTK